jgi:hypothetical protein
MFGFFKKKAEVLEHWIAFVEGFQLSSAEFYDSVEKELKARELPGMEMSRIEFGEGGVLSNKRLYLRMVRERLVFDVCAAPFGRSFFFSCRFAEIPAVVKLWQILLLVIGLAVCANYSLLVLFKVYGLEALILWPLGWAFLLVASLYVMRNALAMGLEDLDRTLIQTPVIGAVYEAWIRKETYYRQDTRLMYLEIVSRVVKRLAEDAVAAKGVKLTSQYEQAPILGELYRRVKPELESVK